MSEASARKLHGAGVGELRALLVGRAAAARDLGGWPAGRALTLRAVMRSGVLAGQPLHFRSHQGDLLLSCAFLPRPSAILSRSRSQTLASCKGPGRPGQLRVLWATAECPVVHQRMWPCF